MTVDGDALRLTTAAGEAILPLLKTDGLQAARSQVEARGAQVFDVLAPFASRSPALLPPNSLLPTPYSPADNPADLLYATFLGGSTDRCWQRHRGGRDGECLRDG